MEASRARARFLLLIGLTALLLAACTAGENPSVDMASPEGYTAGFWLGLWQGFIVPVTFFISLFADSVNIYEVYNSGNWYDFGFVIGAGILLGGGFGGWRYRSR